MVRGQGSTVVGEGAAAAVFRCLPHPGVFSTSQRLGIHVPSVVNEVVAELIGRWIVSDDLQSAHILFSDTAVRWVHNESPTGPPLVDIARENPHRWSFCCCDSLTLSKPSANEYVEPVECAGTWRCGHDSPRVLSL